jgi:phosphoglycerate dehydrogenase-like enzyme
MHRILIAIGALALMLVTPAGKAEISSRELIESLGLHEAQVASRDLPGWKAPRKAVVLLDDESVIERLRKVAPGVTIKAVNGSEEALTEMTNADVLIGSCEQELLAAAPRLHWVQVYRSGVESCVVNPGMRTGDKILTNGQRLSSNALAEHAIALTMALARGLDVYLHNQSQARWIGRGELVLGPSMELAGRTMLVVGLGGIGTQTARRAHGLGMNVIATRGSRREGPDYVDYVGLADEVLDLAGRADVVVNTAPLTEQTRGMFDAEFFRAMKSTAYFVSVGRGGSTVTDDLVAALKNGDIAGAGLDVTDPEPLPDGHELWSLPRVIISPHVGGRSDKGWERLHALLVENLRRYVAGEPMLSQVNIERGY